MDLRFMGVVALVATGCTLDYEGLVDGAGGDAPSSTSSGEATSTTTSSTSTTTAATTTATGTSTSTSTGDGGAGQGGTGGAGGQPGEGGGGGAGGELPFSQPCEGLSIVWSDDLDASLGDVWEEATDGDPTLTSDARTGLTVGLGGAVDDAEAGGVQTVDDEALFECSVTVDVTAFDPAAPEEGFVGAGILSGDLGIDVVVEAGDGGPRCVVRSGALFTEGATSVDCPDEAPERTLRIRHTGTELCFDMGPLGGPLEPLGPCLPVEGRRPVFVGAAAESDARVTLGAID